MSASPLLIDIKFSSVRQSNDLTAEKLGREVIFPNDGRDHPRIFDGVKYALVWKPDQDLFVRLPDLEILFSLGAGVDHILNGQDVPDVPIVRFVDHSLTTRMSEWIVLQSLMHLRQQRKYDALQDQAKWQELPQPQASEITVGIMGMGVLGQDAASKLQTIGFNVIGWSRTKKSIEGMECFGKSDLDEFLGKTDFLVGLLPLTAETRGIFNRNVFARLRKQGELASPVFINAGRGGSQVEVDILACLDDGTLGGVSLDVFEHEPLPQDSPLWHKSNAILTPHASAVSDIRALVVHVRRQIERHERGEQLEHVVDRTLGY